MSDRIERKPMEGPEDLVFNDKTFDGLMRKSVSDITCPRCNKGKLVYVGIVLCFTPARIECTECDLKEGFYQFMGKELVHVEPLPEGAYAKIKQEDLNE